MTEKNNMLVRAAIAGLMGAAIIAAPSANAAKAKTLKMEVVKCYGVNGCKHHGKCGGPGHDCAGQNECKGQGWLYMPKESCTAIEGGSLTAPAAAATTK